MTREEVISKMACVVLEGVENKFTFADDVAKKWWIDHHTRALEVAESLGWILVEKE